MRVACKLFSEKLAGAAVVGAALAFASVGAVAAEPKVGQPQNIYVIGDSLGGSLWIGLYETYRGRTDVAIKRHTKISSGIVRYDYYDWQAQAEKLVAKTKIDMVVMMIGGNDRQPIRVEGKRYRERVGTDLWKATYGDRVEKLIRTFTDRGIRFTWVGMPTQRDTREDALGRMINDIFKERCAKLNVDFIPIYKMFGDDKGMYSAYLKDEQGRRKLMRARDGKHFTTTGVKWLGRHVAGHLDERLKVMRQAAVQR